MGGEKRGYNRTNQRHMSTQSTKKQRGEGDYYTFNSSLLKFKFKLNEQTLSGNVILFNNICLSLIA